MGDKRNQVDFSKNYRELAFRYTAIRFPEKIFLMPIPMEYI